VAAQEDGGWSSPGTDVGPLHAQISISRVVMINTAPAIIAAAMRVPGVMGSSATDDTAGRLPSVYTDAMRFFSTRVRRRSLLDMWMKMVPTLAGIVGTVRANLATIAVSPTATIQEEILMPRVCTINSCRPRRDRPHAAQRCTARGAVRSAARGPRRGAGDAVGGPGGPPVQEVRL